MLISRRGILGGLASMLASPAIVHAGNLMPVKVVGAVRMEGHYLGGGVAVYGSPFDELIADLNRGGVWEKIDALWVLPPNNNARYRPAFCGVASLPSPHGGSPRSASA
jgi:hypothetical protein